MPEKPQPQRSTPGANSARRASGAHLVPTEQHRSAADAFLRGQPVDDAMSELVECTVRGFGWAEKNYIAEARKHGDRSRLWDTTRWIIANAIARQAGVWAGG